MLGCGLAAADGGFVLLPAVLCLAFALLMQIDANLINDLWDYLKGSDGEDRLGPERACAQRWITPKSMRRGILLSPPAPRAAGSSPTEAGGSSPSAPPASSSHSSTRPGLTRWPTTAGATCSYCFSSDSSRSVARGPRAGQRHHLLSGFAAAALCLGLWGDGRTWAALLPLLYLPPHVAAWRRMVRIGRGRELNAILGATSRNILLFGLLLTLGLLL